MSLLQLLRTQVRATTLQIHHAISNSYSVQLIQPNALFCRRGISYNEKMKQIKQQQRRQKTPSQLSKNQPPLVDKDSAPLKIPIDEAVRYLTASNVGRSPLNYKLHIRLLVADEKGELHGELILPHLVPSEDQSICVIADGVQADAARAAGATLVGSKDVIEQIQEGVINFRRCICHVDQVHLLKSVQRILGPAGLMPTEKRGTIVTDVAAAIKESIQVVRFKLTKDFIRICIGNAGSTPQQLQDNILAFFQHLEAQNIKQGRRLVHLASSVYANHSFVIPIQHGFKIISR